MSLLPWKILPLSGDVNCFVVHYTSLSTLEILFPFNIIYDFLIFLSYKSSNFSIELKKTVFKLLVKCLNNRYYSVFNLVKFIVAHYILFEKFPKYVYCMYAFYFGKPVISLGVVAIQFERCLIETKGLLKLANSSLLISEGM